MLEASCSFLPQLIKEKAIQIHCLNAQILPIIGDDFSSRFKDTSIQHNKFDCKYYSEKWLVDHFENSNLANILKNDY